MDERVARRLELRRSNAAVPHRNRYRERKTTGWDDDCSGYDDIPVAAEPEVFPNEDEG